MDISAILSVSLPLLLIAVGMLVWHVRAWRSFQRQGLDPAELHYRRRQFRRRMQTSAMLGLLAVAFPVGDRLAVRMSAGWLVAYGVGMILLACWIVLLGVVDIWATRHYFNRLRDADLLEHVKLQAELRRLELQHQRADDGKVD